METNNYLNSLLGLVGRTPSQAQACKEIYELLREEGYHVGDTVPRKGMNAVIVRGVRCSHANVLPILRTGEALGYWMRDRDDDRPKASARIVLLDPSVVAVEQWV
jgi:hypothetical protein